MKNLICALLAAVLIVPAISFAQTTNAPITRAEVRAELVQLEQAGYQPAARQNHYPDEIQAAEARLHAANGTYASSDGVRVNGSAGGPASIPVAPTN
ncbi:MAG TPA: DUF4148 domain-containing protein [Caballeronia sp.]|jgi:hypothetical protein|nr:DUF4148 domain-containing protein [Caballeronia sp.]